MALRTRIQAEKQRGRLALIYRPTYGDSATFGIGSVKIFSAKKEITRLYYRFHGF
jgi:hypothetical protein